MSEKLITKSFERLQKGGNRGFITYEELGKSLGKGGSQENTERVSSSNNKITLVEKSEFQPLKKKSEAPQLKKNFR